MFGRLKSPLLASLSFVASLVIGQSTHAYLVGTYGKDIKLDPMQRTRVLVAARGSELVSLFQESAAAKAKKYRELYPNDQILFVTLVERPENSKGFKIKYDNDSVLKEYNWSVKEKTVVVGFNPMQGNQYSDKLTAKALIDELAPFKKIASIDIYSHSTPTYGILLEGKWNRLDEHNKDVLRLKGQFTEDAFVFLHGCNTGAAVAQHLSKVWQVPVAGSLTSTNSQRLFSDGNFYYDDSGRYPKDVKKATLNKMSYKKNQPCYQGNCLRLKPENAPYTGYWGKFENGLPFYKFFCVDIDENSCKKTMAISMLSQLSIKSVNEKSSLEDFKLVAKENLCPTDSKGTLQTECMEKLDEIVDNGGDETYNPFYKEQLQCGFNGCEVEYDCKEIPIINFTIPESCKIINKSARKANTLVQEYKNYLEGFKLLQESTQLKTSN